MLFILLHAPGLAHSLPALTWLTQFILQASVKSPCFLQEAFLDLPTLAPGPLLLELLLSSSLSQGLLLVRLHPYPSAQGLAQDRCSVTIW